jgi:hypothetical protein
MLQSSGQAHGVFPWRVMQKRSAGPAFISAVRLNSFLEFAAAAGINTQSSNGSLMTHGSVRVETIDLRPFVSSKMVVIGRGKATVDAYGPWTMLENFYGNRAPRYLRIVRKVDASPAESSVPDDVRSIS